MTPLHFRAAAYVQRPVAEVWSLFADISRWQDWSPICVDCRLVAGARLEPGCVIRMRLRIAGMKILVDATIVELVPESVITWKAQRFGVIAIHTYRFESRGTGTRMINEETFSGLPVPIRVLMSWWYRRHGIGEKSLAGLHRVLTNHL